MSELRVIESPCGEYAIVQKKVFWFWIEVCRMWGIERNERAIACAEKLMRPKVIKHLKDSVYYY